MKIKLLPFILFSKEYFNGGETNNCSFKFFNTTYSSNSTAKLEELKFKDWFLGTRVKISGGVVSLSPPVGATTWAHAESKVIMSAKKMYFIVFTTSWLLE